MHSIPWNTKILTFYVLGRWIPYTNFKNTQLAAYWSWIVITSVVTRRSQTHKFYQYCDPLSFCRGIEKKVIFLTGCCSAFRREVFHLYTGFLSILSIYILLLRSRFLLIEQSRFLLIEHIRMHLWHSKRLVDIQAWDDDHFLSAIWLDWWIFTGYWSSFYESNSVCVFVCVCVCVCVCLYRNDCLFDILFTCITTSRVWLL